MKTIVIDPGHGGRDSGAIGPNQFFEKDITLEIANRLRSALKDLSYWPVATRLDDTYRTPFERVAISNQRQADLFLSLHCNASSTHQGRGYEAFTSPGSTAADPIATALLKAYGKQFPALTARTDPSDGDPDKEARFVVLTKTRCPAVLFELGFIDTVSGEEFLTSPSNQIQIVAALARGIKEALDPQQSNPTRTTISMTSPHIQLTNRATGTNTCYPLDEYSLQIVTGE